jgi:hypothetical protein
MIMKRFLVLNTGISNCLRKVHGVHRNPICGKDVAMTFVLKAQAIDNSRDYFFSFVRAGV